MTDFTGAPNTGIVNNMWDTANQFADYNGGWSNTAKKYGGEYVDAHGGAAGTAAHVGHNAFNTVANAAWGAKDWGNAYRAAKSGNWGQALSSGLWGLASVGATASMVLPGAGEVIKGAELTAQAARAARAGETIASLGAKEAAEVGAKEAVEAGAEGAVKEGASNTDLAGKIAKWSHRAHTGAETVDRLNSFMHGTGKAEVQPQPLVNPRIY